MICQACRDDLHGECRGGSWCDCQHQPRARAASGSGIADDSGSQDPPGAEPGERDAETGRSEPRVNWKRQG
ncbi:hypothetical protein [Actinomadura sp. 9N407]|uniref:hypothetical protein n=1 Tax=Actinomadura sp. 9N407 TaxID=3375154 RepID=UPI00378F7D7B